MHHRGSVVMAGLLSLAWILIVRSHFYAPQLFFNRFDYFAQHSFVVLQDSDEWCDR